MVNKFGDHSGIEGIYFHPIEKVVHTKGKFGDYVDHIITTYRLGLIPHREAGIVAAVPVFTYANTVYCLGGQCCDRVGGIGIRHYLPNTSHIGQLCAAEEITEMTLSKDDILVTFRKAGHGGEGTANSLIFRGDPGPCGPMGKHGKDGPSGSPGPKGEDGMQGPPGQKGEGGRRGSPGADGIPGKDGMRGPPGEKGEDGSRGPPGTTGRDGSQGEPGTKGKDGKDGFDVCKWLSKFTLKQFRIDEEETCLLITDPDVDLKRSDRGKYIQWISRSIMKKNATAVKASTSCRKIKEGSWGLNFPGIYRIDGIVLSTNDCIFTCITFQIKQEKKVEQFIFCDFDDEFKSKRGISVTNDAIRIYGVENEDNFISIPFSVSEDVWTTVLVEYLPTKYGRMGSCMINSKQNRKSFICNKLGTFEPGCTYIGGRKDLRRPMKGGSICAVECLDSVDKAPDNLKEMVMRGQQQSIDLP